MTARYVKLQGTAPHDDWQLVLFEMELYGPETPAEELSPVHFIRLRLTDDAGNLLSENFYWRSNRLGDYRALNDLEPAKLDVRTKAETVDGKRNRHEPGPQRGVRRAPHAGLRLDRGADIAGHHGRQLLHAAAG